MKINSKSSPHRKKLIIIISVAAVLLLGGGAYATYAVLNQPKTSDTKSSDSKDINTVDYDAPTSEQEQSGADIKDGTVNTPTNTDSSKTDAEVVITFAGQVNNFVKI